MPTRLTNNLTSDYVSAANRLRSKTARHRIVAYVESYDDVYFWRSVLSQYEDEHRYFEVMLPSRKTLAKGKKTALMNIVASAASSPVEAETTIHAKTKATTPVAGETPRTALGESMIACVDADYDYLMQGCTPMSKMVTDNPYVFHTYAYAIENLQCYAPSLHNVCVAVTLNDHLSFDFVGFLQQYSEAIFPLFVWNIWFYRHNDHSFTISDFNQVISTGSFREDQTTQTLAHVRRKVGVRIRQFHRQFPHAKEEWLTLKEELKRLGVAPRDTYLYIQGHHLYDSLVVPMLKRLCDQLIKNRETAIARMATHAMQKNNELAGYSHSLADVNTVLRRNIAFFSSAPYQKLRQDLEAFLRTTRPQQTEGLPASPSPASVPQP